MSFLSNISIGDASVLAGLGYGIVFVGLVALLAVVVIMSKIFVAIENRKQAKAAAAAPAAPAEAASAEPDAPTAPGSAGGIKLYDVPPKTAAMVMAIVADSLGKPLNELRFISIKEVK